MGVHGLGLLSLPSEEEEEVAAVLTLQEAGGSCKIVTAATKYTPLCWCHCTRGSTINAIQRKSLEGKFVLPYKLW